MEPPKASAVPSSHGFIKDFSTQGLHPTRQTAAEGSLELFSNSSWGEELNYPQLTEKQTSHEFTTKQDPARGEGFRSIRAHRWGQGRFAQGSGTAPFLQGATGTELSPWGQDPGPGRCSQSWFGFFP